MGTVYRRVYCPESPAERFFDSERHPYHSVWLFCSWINNLLWRGGKEWIILLHTCNFREKLFDKEQKKMKMEIFVIYRLISHKSNPRRKYFMNLFGIWYVCIFLWLVPIYTLNWFFYVHCPFVSFSYLFIFNIFLSSSALFFIIIFASALEHNKVSWPC